MNPSPESTTRSWVDEPGRLSRVSTHEPSGQPDAWARRRKVPISDQNRRWAGAGPPGVEVGRGVGVFDGVGVNVLVAPGSKVGVSLGVSVKVGEGVVVGDGVILGRPR